MCGNSDPLAGHPTHDDDGGSRQATLVQLRAWLMRHDFAPGTRLPPERDLSETLGVSRGELRKALATLETKARSGGMPARAPSSGRAASR